MPLTTPQMEAALRRWADRLDEAAPELNRLDGQLGDGDLGATLEKCAARVRAALDAGPYPDLGLLFKACAQGCARASGSSFGTLLTVAFLTLARRLENQAALAWRDVPEMLQAALDAMAQRGGATLGDKTVLDALAAAQAAIVGLDEPHAQHAAASAAVEATIASFREKPNRIGRARMFAERSIGLDDPGMIAFRHMLAGIAPRADA
ncbi:DAK2 domain-containing protein [Paraburkholderia caballeronis]|uniref:Dihydroxyacetone kinase, C-terminal domain n=1 Tax=Paraburkholderia caballeronis TaxID=416943 RepID=A0A1H7HD82_9BURK|nr:DAK2 domain-containing protein [Paraburkholderia caballeronis]PXW29621.1 dihydroxyacetone kinase-like protein [Paraburkholderia caballeronis]PXX04880.1 dihydroxyacetone kinase-like protein [Paraburkholderia caballeronis]RAK05941.1 dihydroxyacetone kinase-like protein [Paraburkholderia caballeronis]SEB44369.1 dihydroxyacetone kinase, C-terminal domain [Paraburkholderia caballeronis]SEK46155.1 dihydroxyacetone kinase, C-terminal domain [Paraburkholderia caballeronis]